MVLLINSIPLRFGRWFFFSLHFLTSGSSISLRLCKCTILPLALIINVSVYVCCVNAICVCVCASEREFFNHSVSHPTSHCLSSSMVFLNTNRFICSVPFCMIISVFVCCVYAVAFCLALGGVPILDIVATTKQFSFRIQICENDSNWLISVGVQNYIDLCHYFDSIVHKSYKWSTPARLNNNNVKWNGWDERKYSQIQPCK